MNPLSLSLREEEHLFVHVVRCHKRRKVLQPETGTLRLRVPEHPRLYRLCRLADFRTDDADRILKRNALNRCVEEKSYKVESFRLLLLLAPEVPSTADCEMCAGRKGNEQIPFTIQDVSYISLIVLASTVPARRK